MSALHPSGLFTTNASVWFTNNLAQEAEQIYRDGAGNITPADLDDSHRHDQPRQALFWDGKGTAVQRR